MQNDGSGAQGGEFRILKSFAAAYDPRPLS
jgi:hypothetical protein